MAQTANLSPTLNEAKDLIGKNPSKINKIEAMDPSIKKNKIIFLLFNSSPP